MNATMDSLLTREHMILYVECGPQQISNAIELLHDVAFDAQLSEGAIEEEKVKLIERLEHFNDQETTDVLTDNLQSDFVWTQQSLFRQPMTSAKQMLIDLMHAAAFQGTPLANSLLGTKPAIEMVNRQSMIDHMSTNFRGPQMLLLSCGPDLQHEQIVSQANQLFAHLPGLHLGLYYPDRLRPCRFTGSDIRVRDDAMPLAHVIVATEGSGYDTPNDLDNVVLMLAATAVGSWNRHTLTNTAIESAMSSNKLRVACASCPGIVGYDSFSVAYADTGLWGCYFIADRTHQEDMIFYLQQTWMGLCSSPSKTLLEQSKRMLKLQLLQEYEHSRLVSFLHTGQLSLAHETHIESLEELVSKIDSVTVGTFKRVLMNYVYDRCPVVAAIGPVENLDDYSRIRSGMYWLRL